MKKSLWIGFLAVVIAILVAGAYFFINCEKEEKFVNPLFYKTLYPLTPMAWETKLTPTLKISVDGNDKEIAVCKMLDNTYESITLKCTYFNRLIKEEETRFFKYTIWQCNPDREHCYGSKWKVQEKIMDTYNQEDSSWFNYTIKEED